MNKFLMGWKAGLLCLSCIYYIGYVFSKDKDFAQLLFNDAVFFAIVSLAV